MRTDIKAMVGNFIVVFSAMAIVLFVAYLRFAKEEGTDFSHIKETASALEARGLYKEAISELDRYRKTGLSKEEEADLLYKMAKMADGKLGDCDRALAYYTMATALKPDASWSNEAGKRSVVCMEKTGKKKQAQSLLVQLTGDDSAIPAIPEYAKDSPTVAVIDGRSVTWAEVELAMKIKMRPEDLADPEKRKQMVHGYVLSWMMAEEARRAGLDSSPEIKSAIEQVRREALATAYAENKLGGTDDEEVMKKVIEELFKLHEARIFNEAIPAP